MDGSVIQTEEVQITSERADKNIESSSMSQTKIEITDTEIKLYYRIVNKITQDDYIVELTDTNGGVPYTNYENNYYDLSGDERYSVEKVTDPSGNVTINYAESTASGITGNSWNALLGFTDVSYSLTGTERKIIGSRDIMHDISKTMIIDEKIYENNAIFFTPQSSVKGLIDSNGVKKIEIDVPDGIYTTYGLYNVINYDLSNNPETEHTRLYSTFDRGIEYSVFRTCINMKYTAEDYILQFYDQETSPVQNVTAVTTNSFQATTNSFNSVSIGNIAK